MLGGGDFATALGSLKKLALGSDPQDPGSAEMATPVRNLTKHPWPKGPHGKVQTFLWDRHPKVSLFELSVFVF